MQDEKFLAKIRSIQERYELVEKKINSLEGVSREELIELNKEYSGLNGYIHLVQDFLKFHQEMEQIEENLQRESDADMREMFQSELQDLQEKIEQIKQELRVMLLPVDEDDHKNVILEIRAGTGGDEAALFAADLFNMYSRFAALMSWKFEVISISNIGIGGYKEAIASIEGKNVFAHLKFESGVHRIQRVPETEAGGRIHTSAATVAILPEAQEIDIKINPNDLKIDLYRSSGPGGQSVNTTDSAVRITHLPTGLVVTQQDEKSQHKNKNKAMRILMSRIYDLEKSKAQAERSSNRKQQIGSGDRSERIRTYNFPQNRITDHRINITVHKIDEILKEGNLMHIIKELQNAEKEEKLAQIEE